MVPSEGVVMETSVSFSLSDELSVEKKLTAVAAADQAFVKAVWSAVPHVRCALPYGQCQRLALMAHRVSGLLDMEDQPVRFATTFQQPVPGLANQIWNVDLREWIIGDDHQPTTRRLAFQRLPRLERGERAFEAHEIQRGFVHCSLPCGML